MNKELLKITGLTAIAAGLLYCFTIVLAFIGFILIFGGSKMIHYSNLSDEELNRKVLPIAIWSFFFFFLTFVCGLLGFLSFAGSNKKIYGKENYYIGEIRRINELKKKGIIDENDYQTQKKNILGLQSKQE